MAFACIFIPDFPVQAVIRQDPDLRNKPVAILEGAAPLTKVFAANAAARALGVEIGMTKLQAETCPGVERRWRSPSQEVTAHAALLDCAWTISPRIEEAKNGSETDLPGTVVLDIAGCEKLFGSQQKIADDLKRIAAEVGLEANVSIAGNPEAAICAARGFAGVTLIPPGKEADYLSPLPLSALNIPGELLETLARWGIHTCAEFAVLPEIAVIERLGQPGQHWQRLCRGTDLRQLLAKEFPDHFEECLQLEFSVDLLEPLLFVLNRLLEQLCLRLRMHILATTEVKITLTLQPDDLRNKQPVLHIRTLRLPMPVAQSKMLLKLLQLDLQAHPPNAPVTAIHISAVPTRSRTRQLGSVPSSKPGTRGAGNYLGAHSKHCGRRPCGSTGATGFAPARCVSAKPLRFAGSFAENFHWRASIQGRAPHLSPTTPCRCPIARQTARRNLLRRRPQTSSRVCWAHQNERRMVVRNPVGSRGMGRPRPRAPS